MRACGVVVWPAELGGDEVAEGRELGGVGVHLTDELLSTALLRLPELQEHAVQPRQQGAVERVVVSQQLTAGRDVVKHLFNNQRICRNIDWIKCK